MISHTPLNARANRAASAASILHRGAKWFGCHAGRLLFAAAVLLSAQSWSSDAKAFTVGCELYATGGNVTASGQSGSNVSLSFDLVNIGSCPSVAITASMTDSSGGAILVTPGAGPTVTTSDSSYSVTVTLGDNDTGSVVVRIGCASCVNVTFIDFTFNLANTFALNTVGGNSKTVRPGENVTLQFKALRNGQPYQTRSGYPVSFSISSSPFDASPPSLGSVATDSSGNGSVTFSHSPSTQTKYTISALMPDPNTGYSGNVSTVFVVDIGEWQITTFGGTSQSPYTYNRMSPVEVVLVDASSNPVSGETIHWSLSGAAGSAATLGTVNESTNGAGKSSTVITTGNTSGSMTLKAEITAKPSVVPWTVNFTVSDISAPGLVVNSGDFQSGVPGQTLSGISVHATNNSGGDAVGAPITWTVLSGDATVANASTRTITDGTGSNNLTLGTTRGTVQLRADFLGATTKFTFSFSDTWDLIAQTPTEIYTGTGEPVTLTARYLFNEAAADNAVLWSHAGRGTLGGVSVIPDANGDASTTFSASTPGVYTVTAQGDCPIAAASAAAGTPPSPKAVSTRCPPPSLTYTITVTDRTLVGGGSFPGTTQESLLLTVRAEDDGSPASGVGIDWALSGDGVLASASSSTAGSGEATNTVTFGNTPGTVVVTATRKDVPTASASFVFAVATPTMNLVSGDGQSGLAGTAGEQPLTVQLVDASGAAIAGETIAWSVTSGSINLSSSNASTDGNGKSSMPFSFGSTVGPATVRASARGSIHVDFQLDVLGGDIIPGGGNGQSGAIGEPLPEPLKVRVSLPASPAAGGGAPQGLAGVPVQWVVTQGGGSVSASNTFTDANGESSVIFTLGPDPGTHSVTATTPGGTTVFTATAFIPTGVLTIISGDEQTLPTNTESEPLVVELRTEDGEPIAGVAIEWNAENAELDADSTETDSSGRAQVIAKVLEPGAASITAASTRPDAGPVTFTLNGAVANLDNLDPIEEQIAEVIDQMCPALAAIPNPTPEQQDLLQRCLEIVDAAGIDPEATIAALNQWFEELVQAQSDATLIALQSQLQNLQGRLAALRGGSPSNGFAGLTLLGPGGSVPLVGLFKSMAGEEGTDLDAGFSRWGWFVSGNIGRGEFDPTSTTPAFDYDINGLTSGIDYRVNDNFIVGGSLGYTAQDTDARDDSGSLETRGWSVSGYGSWFNDTNWYVDGVLTWGRNDYRSLRTIQYTLPLIGGGTVEIDQLARGTSDGDQLQAAFTLGRDFQRGAWNFGTYGRLLYSRVEFGESREILQEGPGSGLGLAVRSRDLTSLATVLGGKASYAYSAAWGVLMPTFELEWERETKDDPTVVEAYFIHDPTQSPILITGSAVDRSFFRLGFGLSMLFANGRSGFVYYERLAGRTGQSQENLSLGFRMEF